MTTIRTEVTDLYRPLKMPRAETIRWTIGIG